MTYNFKNSIKIKILLIFVILFTTLYFIKLSSNIILISHLFDKKILIENFNIQGIECINDIILLLENNSDVFEYSNKKIKKKFTLKRLEEDVYNNINIVSHPTSFAIFDNNIGYTGNAMPLQAVSLVKFNLEKLISDRFLSTDAVLDIEINDIYNSNFDKRGIHLSNYKNGDINFLVVGANLSKNSSVIDFYNPFNRQKQCELNYRNHIQNIFFEEINKKIYVLSNIIFLRGAKIEIYGTTLKNNCPELIYEKKIIPLTVMELEGYTYCQNKHLFAYVDGKNSYIIERQRQLD